MAGCVYAEIGRRKRRYIASVTNETLEAHPTSIPLNLRNIVALSQTDLFGIDGSAVLHCKETGDPTILFDLEGLEGDTCKLAGLSESTLLNFAFHESQCKLFDVEYRSVIHTYENIGCVVDTEMTVIDNAKFCFLEESPSRIVMYDRRRPSRATTVAMPVNLKR